MYSNKSSTGIVLNTQKRPHHHWKRYYLHVEIHARTEFHAYNRELRIANYCIIHLIEAPLLAMMTTRTLLRKTKDDKTTKNKFFGIISLNWKTPLLEFYIWKTSKKTKSLLMFESCNLRRNTTIKNLFPANNLSSSPQDIAKFLSENDIFISCSKLYTKSSKILVDSYWIIIST